MILTVTPNIAQDITYTVDSFALHTSTRVDDVASRAGGKGVNVSRVSAKLGRSTCIVGFVGGNVGRSVVQDLTDSGLDHELVAISGETRRSVTVVDSNVGDATVLNESGPLISPSEWDALVALVDNRLSHADVLVISGSLPPGVASPALTDLVRRAAQAEVPVVVDTSGPALIDVVAARPALVKPNNHEVVAATGIADPVAAARSLIERGAGAVALSMGADGMALITKDRALRARPTEFVHGNPTGAGDASVAALAYGINEFSADTLRDAVALSAAAVAAPLAGDFDSELYERLLTQIDVEEF